MHKIIAKLVSLYPIDDIVSSDKIRSGYMNHSYIIKTKKRKYILRIGKKTKEKKDILFEINLLNSLKDLPVPKYLKDKKGNYVNNYKGQNYALYNYIEGTQPNIISEDLFKEIAFFLARFHNQTKNFYSKIDRFSWYTFSDEKILFYKENLLKNLKKYKKEIIFLEKEMKMNRIPEMLPQGPIHCDIKKDNILTINSKLNGVIDFDNCQNGPYILDIAIAINWLCTNKEGLDYKKTSRFIRYYQRYRKLNNEEKTFLFLAVKYAYISHEFVDFYVYAKKIIPKKYFNEGRKLFLNAVKNLDKEKFNRHVNSRFAWFYNMLS